MWTKAFFHSLQKETELTWKFFIKIEVDKFNYTAGQFIQIKINDLIRSYSIASFNENSNVVELIIVKLKGGEMSTLLFEKITVGDELEVKGPLGKFLLPDEIIHDICMVCTGTGIAPFRSMIKYIYENNISHKNIYLICGTRTKKDLLDHKIDIYHGLTHELPLGIEKTSIKTVVTIHDLIFMRYPEDDFSVIIFGNFEIFDILNLFSMVFFYPRCLE